jgi:hypothetical protein
MNMAENEASPPSLKRSWLRRFWWIWTYLVVFVIADLVISSWFFFGKDVNHIHDPYGWDAVEAFGGRFFWSWSVIASSFLAILITFAAWLVGFLGKATKDL